jgi:serine/threonine protein kinase
LIGNILGNRYRILREIGAGGMAKVYLAEDIKGNELVALKLLYPQFGEDISFIQRFNREAKLASTLTDPHIVRVLDYGADRDLHYLVMEYVEGQDLHDVLQEQEYFEWRYALEMIDQLATALEHAHAHGVVHRDIKPQNMMLDDSGLLKVLDFGIARIPTLPSLTQSGFIGSPYYASPEQAMGEEVDIRSDIYSSGVVLYELLSGNIPFDAKSPWSIISQHITSEPPPIELEDGEVPANVKALLSRMLAKRAEERYQTPTALRQAIAAVLTGQDLPADIGTAAPIISGDNAPMIESLTERALQAIGTKEWMRAVDLLSQAAKLDPDNPEITDQLAMVEAEARLSSLYKSGKRAMENGRWEEAINHFNVIVELQPTYLDTKTLLNECHAAFKDENTQQFVGTRYQEGLAHLDTQRWESAVDAFAEVQDLSPGYEQVEYLLAQAKQHKDPGLLNTLNRALPGGVLRWALVAVGVIVILIASFFVFGNSNQASSDGNEVRDRLKAMYEEAQSAIETGDIAAAVAKLDEIFDEDPDYADVADLRRELVATPTPAVPPTPTIDPIAALLADTEDALAASNWTVAIETLKQVRAQDPDYEDSRVASLFCDAYVARGMDTLASIQPDHDQLQVISQAQQDFEAGVAECPRRTDLTEQAGRTLAYLTALDTPPSNHEDRIKILSPIVAAEPDFASGNAKQMLYQAYLGRAAVRQESPAAIASALGDYEAALALNVADPSEANTRRAELLLMFTQVPLQPTIAPVATTAADAPNPTPTTAPDVDETPAPAVAIKYQRPQLIGPPDDTVFAGQFAEVFLEWEPVGTLAGDEYYDVTIMHLFADQPNYSGSLRTEETTVQITQDIGVGQAGGDRFYWWVTVRKDNTARPAGGLDKPLSPRSEASTFVWSP